MGAAHPGPALIDAAAAPDMLLLGRHPALAGDHGGRRLLPPPDRPQHHGAHVEEPRLTTVRDDQTSVKIVVFRAKADKAEENELRW